MRRIFPLVAVAALLFGCASGGDGDPYPSQHGGSGGGSSGHAGSGSAGNAGGGTAGHGNAGSGNAGNAGAGGDWTSSICFLHDCDSDDECQGCPNGRTRCSTAERKCVACLTTDSPSTCPDGKECSPYGTCITPGATCSTDAEGNPTISCTTDNDCFACDAQHQVCDTSISKCVTCSSTNQLACAATDRCKDNKCQSRCPNPCSSDADCTECGSLANPGNACNPTTHHCGECSPTVPCKDNEVCGPQGMCIKVCGVQGKPKGTCESDADCGGCEGDAVKCHKPINSGEGKCGLPAAGCSDIAGQGLVVLPAPWNQVTNLCSHDSDCSGVGVDFNIGGALRDITGLDMIHDAVTHYGMNACAAVTVGLGDQSFSCGVCVPCRTDADCKPIQFDPLIDQAFGPIGSLAAKALIKMVFGKEIHQLNMYCETVAADYGVCAPCFDFVHSCGVDSTEGATCTTDYDCALGEKCEDGQCVKPEVECDNDWDCPTNRHCVNHECKPYSTSCFAGEDCTGGQVCSWNGDGYCCRTPGPGTEACFTDAECAPQVCGFNGTSYVCMDRDPNCASGAGGAAGSGSK